MVHQLVILLAQLDKQRQVGEVLVDDDVPAIPARRIAEPLRELAHAGVQDAGSLGERGVRAGNVPIRDPIMKAAPKLLLLGLGLDRLGVDLLC
ncbi:hypothetical protein PG996_011322 [Apiospora saccharicola]|uniref:Uncharacterized protein n=1 Tax=Apiospora saccharicola TaxID=335842 RepID=A0ABR1UEQ4_9PEZI